VGCVDLECMDDIMKDELLLKDSKKGELECGIAEAELGRTSGRAWAVGGGVLAL